MTIRIGRTAGCMALALALAACGEKAAPAADGAAGGPSASAERAPDAPPADGDATVAAPSTVVAGSAIAVTWTGPANAGDYVDLVARGITATSGEITYVYTRDSQNGSAALRAPTEPGDYDVRYVLDLGSSRIVKAVAPVTVTAAAATLTAPTEAGGAEPLSIAWTGPGGEGDYIDLVPAGATAASGEITYAYTRQGNPVTIKAPGATGAYDIRYVLEGQGGRKVLTATTVRVTTPTATLDAPESAAKGAVVKVAWTGPKREGDYVDLVPKGYAQTSGELDYFYVNQPAAEITLPMQPGEFEIRYILEAPDGRIVLARRALVVR